MKKSLSGLFALFCGCLLFCSCGKPDEGESAEDRELEAIITLVEEHLNRALFEHLSGGLGDHAAHDHGGRDILLTFGLAADGLTGLGNRVALTDTGADTGDHGAAGAQRAASENDTQSKLKHVLIPPFCCG